MDKPISLRLRQGMTRVVKKTMECVLWELASHGYKVNWHIGVTMKYRSQWHTKCIGSSIVSDWRGVLNIMMSFYKIRSETQGKSTGPWHIGHSDLQIVWGHSQCQTEQVPEVWCLPVWYGRIYKAIHWTMKYRLQWPTKIWGHSQHEIEQVSNIWCLFIWYSQRYNNWDDMI